MPNNSLYLCNFDKQKFNFVNKDFKQVTPQKLNGLFAYLLYKNINLQDVSLLALSKLNEYGSNHAGINLLQKALRKKLEKVVPKPEDIILTPNEPSFGGEILFLNGEIIFWNFKSTSYSLSHEELHDDNPDLGYQIYTSGLPPERFISIEKAKNFEENYLKSYFFSDGDYKIDAQQVVQMLSDNLRLASPSIDPIIVQQPKEIGAGSKNTIAITPASCAFSFFRSRPLSQALSPAISFNSPKY
ncbi:hypothetical protein ACNVED_03535 [Legionella sp. D16C41]|uniref:hypothetical protein n=1 Tax=Legionella sp. D16C41 TaxID=3402688 RepID=UPI003AF74E2A